MVRFIYIIILVLCLDNSVLAADTLFLRVANPWNTVKDANGKYLRKAVVTDSGILSMDYTSQGILLVRGYFSDTNFVNKLFCHQYFNETEGFLEEIRNYSDGKLNGIRAGFSAKGDTLWRENLEYNSVVARKEFEGYSPKLLSLARVEKPAVFPGGEDGWRDFLLANMKYPNEALKYKIVGVVKVKFAISKEGVVTNVMVAESAHPLLDEEAVRLIKSSPNWEPAMHKGNLVFYVVMQNVNFRL